MESFFERKTIAYFYFKVDDTYSKQLNEIERFYFFDGSNVYKLEVRKVDKKITKIRFEFNKKIGFSILSMIIENSIFLKSYQILFNQEVKEYFLREKIDCNNITAEKALNRIRKEFL